MVRTVIPTTGSTEMLMGPLCYVVEERRTIAATAITR